MRGRKRVGGCLLVMLFLLVASLTLGYSWYRFGLSEPYRVFRAREREIVPQLDALNESVAQSLPPLPGDASESKRWSVGITNPVYDHGRWLFISISTTLTDQVVSSYYRENLLATGWSEYTETHTGGINTYYRNTSCLEILLPSQYIQNYKILIWHDFQSQSFSPPLPNLDYMRFAEYGETNFATCPP